MNSGQFSATRSDSTPIRLDGTLVGVFILTAKQESTLKMKGSVPMDTEDLKIKSYLDELYRQTGGDTEVQVSMYDLGAVLGLDRSEAGSLAEQLMVQGQAELRTLAGGISITNDGLAVLGYAVAAPHSAGDELRLGDGPVADEADRRTVHLLCEEIKKELSGAGLEYDLTEEVVLDLKTIELHLLSPRPKTAVLRALFCSLQETLTIAEIGKIATRLKIAIG